MRRNAPPISSVAPVRYTRSPARSLNSPSGMDTSPSRSTAQNSTRMPVFFGSSCSGTPSSGLSSGRRRLTSSARPLANSSTLAADGKRSSRAISCAAASSGLMTMDRPRSSLRK